MQITLFVQQSDTHIDGGGFCYRDSVRPVGSRGSPSGVKIPVTERPPVYVCKDNTGHQRCNRIIFLLKKCGGNLLWAAEEQD